MGHIWAVALSQSVCLCAVEVWGCYFLCWDCSNSLTDRQTKQMQKKKKGEWEINNKEFRKQDSLALRAKFHDGDLQAKPLNQSTDPFSWQTVRWATSRALVLCILAYWGHLAISAVPDSSYLCERSGVLLELRQKSGCWQLSKQLPASCHSKRSYPQLCRTLSL